TIDQRTVVGIALAQIELATDHIIARAYVAADIDALDIGTRTFFDDKGNVDRLGFEIAFTARPYVSESVAMLGGLDRHQLNAFFDQVRVVDASGAQPELTAQGLRVDRAHVGNDFDIPNPILCALIDRERDDKPFSRGIVLADGGDDAHVSVPVLQIKTAQQIAVRFHPV